jgi:hypothetical protein
MLVGQEVWFSVSLMTLIVLARQPFQFRDVQFDDVVSSIKEPVRTDSDCEYEVLSKSVQRYSSQVLKRISELWSSYEQ